MTIPHLKSIELTNILCVRCSFWRSLPFQACFAITVIDILVIRRRQGWTLQFPPLSTRSWFAPLRSSPSVFFSAIVYDLRSLDPGTCLNTKLHAHFAENERFLPAISKFANLWPWSWWPNWTRTPKTWVRGKFSLYHEWYGWLMYHSW